MFENIQENVLNDIKTSKKAPVFKMNWMYAAAASMALIFGVTYVFNSDHDSADQTLNTKTEYAVNNRAPKTDSELAYETLKSDLTSVEDPNQTVVNQIDNEMYASKGEEVAEKTSETPKPVKATSKKEEIQMNEYLDSFSNSEIAELASNSTQDVYLDIYN
ncbi:hypothetical protein [Chryseobacterium aureum]|uniref:hypothetical protein n=1 Tax=Chryseobacterium aureum TaxID=2497456 RepID=UPI001E30A173|nr:hypothetical protein [Chryseobacterium aureum]